MFFLLQEEEYDVPEELEDIIGWFTSYFLKTKITDVRAKNYQSIEFFNILLQ